MRSHDVSCFRLLVVKGARMIGKIKYEATWYSSVGNNRAGVVVCLDNWCFWMPD